MKTQKLLIQESNFMAYSLKKEKTTLQPVIINSSKTCEEFIRNFYFDDIEIYESVFLLLLNNSNKTIGYVKVSQGGLTGTIVDIRIIAKYCIESLSTSCILAHNHPSGKLIPSQADIDITKKLKDGLKLLDVKVLDHLILTKENYYSFADNGNIL